MIGTLNMRPEEMSILVKEAIIWLQEWQNQQSDIFFKIMNALESSATPKSAKVYRRQVKWMIANSFCV